MDWTHQGKSERITGFLIPSDIPQIVSKMLQSALLFEYFLGLPRSRDHRVVLKPSDYAIQSYAGRTWITHEAVGIIIII